MAVYFYKLWKLLKEKGITQKDLTVMTGISTSTIFQMKRDEYVSLNVLDRIAKALKCDFNDIITNIPKPKEWISEWEYVISLESSRELVFNSYQEYVRENDLSVSDVLEITTLSLNTLKKFLRGENLSQRSYYKMLRLGKDFEDLIIKKSGKPVFSFL